MSPLTRAINLNKSNGAVKLESVCINILINFAWCNYPNNEAHLLLHLQDSHIEKRRDRMSSRVWYPLVIAKSRM